MSISDNEGYNLLSDITKTIVNNQQNKQGRCEFSYLPCFTAMEKLYKRVGICDSAVSGQALLRLTPSTSVSPSSFFFSLSSVKSWRWKPFCGSTASSVSLNV